MGGNRPRTKRHSQPTQATSAAKPKTYGHFQYIKLSRVKLPHCSISFLILGSTFQIELLRIPISTFLQTLTTMSTKIQTQLGESLPPQPHHAITVQLPKWASIVRFAEKDQAFMDLLKSMYPRMIIHQDIKTVSC